MDRPQVEFIPQGPLLEQPDWERWSVFDSTGKKIFTIRQEDPNLFRLFPGPGRTFLSLDSAKEYVIGYLMKKREARELDPPSTLPKDIQNLLWSMVDDTSVAREGALINLILEARREAWVRQALIFRFCPTLAVEDWKWAVSVAERQDRKDPLGFPTMDDVKASASPPSPPPPDSDIRDPFTRPGVPLTVIPPPPGLDRKLFTDILREINMHFEREPAFLHPYPQWTVGVIPVLDALRKRCNPPLSKDDVNQIMELLDKPDGDFHGQ